VPAAAAALKGNRVKAIAVTTEQRSPMLPDVPTIAESGFPGFSMASWFAIVGPAGLPEALQSKLEAALADTLRDPAILERLAGAGIEPEFRPAAAYLPQVQSDIAKLGKIARDNDIRQN
jgi:tripartite-type tricarboxylate transporter receptor subunit TctC